MLARLASALVALMALLAPEVATGARPDDVRDAAKPAAMPKTCCGGECACGDACPCASPSNGPDDRTPAPSIPTKPGERRFEAPIAAFGIAPLLAQDAGDAARQSSLRDPAARAAGRELLARIGRLTI